MHLTLDPAVIKGHKQKSLVRVHYADSLTALPLGWALVDISEHGSSSWSTGYRLSMEKDEKELEYFLKVRQVSTDWVGYALTLSRLGTVQRMLKWRSASMRVKRL